MQVVIKDDAAILKVQAFGEHVRGHKEAYFMVLVARREFGIRFRREASDDSLLALIGAKDDVNVLLVLPGV